MTPKILTIKKITKTILLSTCFMIGSCFLLNASTGFENSLESDAPIFVSSNTQPQIGVFNVNENTSIDMSMIGSVAMDADGIYYDADADVLYQLNRTDNVINAYSNVSSNPTLTATSTSDFINGREIAVLGSKLVVAQDANMGNGMQNRLLVYNISPSSITLDKIYEVSINLWGIHLDGGNLWAVEDNSNRIVAFSNFFMQPAGALSPTTVVEIEGLVRTHGLTYVSAGDMMFLTDVGEASSADDGAIVNIWNFSDAAADGIVTMDEQSRIAGPSTFLGNPVDIAWDAETMQIFVAERANGSGRILAFTGMENASGDVTPLYMKDFAGASAIHIYDENQATVEVLNQFFVSSNTQPQIGVFNINENTSIDMSMIGSVAMDADGIYYDADADVLYQLNRTDNVINAYSNVSSNPTLTATSTSDFINGREIAVVGNKLVVAQDANDANGGTNRLIVYNISPTSITLDKSFDVSINLWGIHADGATLYAIVDNSNQLAMYNNFFSQAPGQLEADVIIEVEGIVRTHGLTYNFIDDIMFLTDVGSGMVADDGAFVMVENFMSVSSDGMISTSEQFRIGGPLSLLGNPVDIAYDRQNTMIYIAERANAGGRVLGFTKPGHSGDVVPAYDKLFSGASAIHLPGLENDVLTGADVSLTVSVNNTLYDQYQSVFYTITVTNDGPEATDNVSVAAGLPDGMVYSGDEVSQGEYELFFERWDVGSLASGASASLELELFTLVEDVAITNFFQVLSSSTDDPDSTPGNDEGNTPDEDDEASITITPISGGGDGGGNGMADLELSISTDATVYEEYDFVTYTISLVNNGPDATSDIIVDVPKPEGMACTDDSATLGEYSLFFREWSIDELNVGETAVLTLTLFNN